MQCICNGGLHYDAPSKGDYGICRMGLMVPESIELFIGPSACGRHGALGAMKGGYKDRIFYLYMNQSDIVKGYDHMIGDAVEELLQRLPYRPKVIILIVTCLDDLIGTDHEALKEDLTARFPGIVFQSSHMNPVKTDTAEPPAQAIQRDIYRTIATDFDNRGIDPKSLTHDAYLNLLGVYEHLPLSCELHKVALLRHVDEYTDFASFTQMAASRYSLLLAPLGTLAAKELEQDFGIPYLYLPVSYDLELIGEAYASLATVLGYENGFDFSEEKNRALRAIQEAKAALGDMPILVDSSATYHPFGLAKALLSYGFHVVRVEAEFVLAEEQPAIDWISTHFPDVECFRPDSYRAVLFDHRLPESLAIGIQSAYMASSKYIVDLFADLQMFGYDGVCRLMQLMMDAAVKPRDLKNLIEEYGLVV